MLFQSRGELQNLRSSAFCKTHSKSEACRPPCYTPHTFVGKAVEDHRKDQLQSALPSAAHDSRQFGCQGSRGFYFAKDLGSPVAETLRRCTACLAALLIGLTAPLAAEANNVRVEDVENPIMQSGLMAANEGRFVDAESLFKIFLKSEGDSASGWSNLGNVHLSLGRPLEAVDDFSKAVSLAPEAPVPYLNRALAKEALGVDAWIEGRRDEARQLYDEALLDCKDATKRDPKEFAAWFNRGNIELRLELFTDALSSYTKAADLAPGISGYRLREAELMFQEGKTEQSDRLMRGVVRKYPYYAEAHAALAAVNWANGKASLAEDHFNAATQIEPGWMSMSYIRNNTRWPPLLYDAMQKFLSMSYKST